MSRVGRKPIKIPEKVKVSIQDSTVFVEGPRGKLSQKLPSEVAVELVGDELRVNRTSETRRAKSMHGLIRTLIANKVRGVSEGFTKALEIVGKGYRVDQKGNELHFSVGFSTPYIYKLPEGISAKVDRQVLITLESIDKELLGQVASEIRAIKPPEPYKGKGIRYVGEHVVTKVGKAGAKK